MLLRGFFFLRVEVVNGLKKVWAAKKCSLMVKVETRIAFLDVHAVLLLVKVGTISLKNFLELDVHVMATLKAFEFATILTPGNRK